MHVRLSIISGIAIATATLLASAPPAAADASLRLNRSTALDPSGDFVIASGSGFAPNAQLFVMQCRATSGEDHTCNSVGLQKVTTDATGGFTANAMRVVARFGATDCTKVACAIKTSAVSGHADDRSQDRSAPISFRAATTTTSPPVPTTAAPPTATTAPPATTTTTTAIAATTTTAASATTTTAAATATEDDDEDPSSDATTTAAIGSDAGATTTTEATGAAKGSMSIDETGDDSDSGAFVTAPGGLAVLGVGGAVAAAAIRRRNATSSSATE